MTKFSKPLYTTSFYLVVDKDKWSDISPEDQAAIMEVSGSYFGAKAGATLDAVGAEVCAKFPSLEISIHEADPVVSCFSNSISLRRIFCSVRQHVSDGCHDVAGCHAANEIIQL